jgi:hypothetical protein
MVYLGKDGSPMGLPVGPSVVNDRATCLLAPGQHHVATCQGVLGICGHHGFVRDGDTGILWEDLTFLLHPCEDGEGGGQSRCQNGGWSCCHPDQVG